MKKFARVMLIAVMLVLCFTLCACGDKYKSSYSSSKMKTTSTSNEASVSFDSFSGTYVIKLESTGNDQVSITYSASLKEGNIKAYFDFNDEKLTLFEIETNVSIEGKTEAFTSDKTIYIVIESDGKCGEGSFSFALEKSN